MNGCRVLNVLGNPDDVTRVGYAYGTLTNHAESGEELSEVRLDPRTDDVLYRIRAVSWCPVSRLEAATSPIRNLAFSGRRQDTLEREAQRVPANLVPSPLAQGGAIAVRLDGAAAQP